MTGRDYSTLTRDELEARLALAEDVCAMFSWSPARYDTDRDKAAYELWRAWAAVAPTDRRDYPHLDDARIAELAARRDEIRAATLARLGLSR